MNKPGKTPARVLAGSICAASDLPQKIMGFSLVLTPRNIIGQFRGMPKTSWIIFKPFDQGPLYSKLGRTLVLE